MGPFQMAFSACAINPWSAVQTYTGPFAAKLCMLGNVLLMHSGAGAQELASIALITCKLMLQMLD